MKNQKQIIVTLFILFLIFFTTSCKKYKQTDKPLYDVLISNVWQPAEGGYYYHFKPDSIFILSSDVNNDTVFSVNPDETINSKWWIEYKDNIPFLYIKNISIIIKNEYVDTVYYFDDGLSELYEIGKYNDFKIITKYYVLPTKTDTLLLRKRSFNAVN